MENEAKNFVLSLRNCDFSIVTDQKLSGTLKYGITYDGKVLCTPAGNEIWSENQSLIRAIMSDLEYMDEVKNSQPSLYNLISTNTDFKHKKLSVEEADIHIFYDPLLRGCAGPEIIHQLKYYQPVIDYFKTHGIEYLSLPQTVELNREWLAKFGQHYIEYIDQINELIRTEYESMIGFQRTVFITTLTIFESPILATMVAKEKIKANVAATMFMTAHCINSKIWVDTDREKEKEMKMATESDLNLLFNFLSFRKNEFEHLIEKGESKTVEFKSSLRWNIREEKKDKNIENASLKTLVAFLNSDGGTLLIGVSDDGKILGIEIDQFENEDKWQLHLSNIFKTRIGAEFSDLVNWKIISVDRKNIAIIECNKSDRPVHLNYEGENKFFIRTGPSSAMLQGDELDKFIESHYGR